MLDIACVLRTSASGATSSPGLIQPRPRRVLVMERLSGFKFDDVAGMHGAGIDTEEVVRTGMIAFMEGAR